MHVRRSLSVSLRLCALLVMVAPAAATPQFIASWSPGPFGAPVKSFLVGTKAYFAMGEEGLWILDIADRSHPALLGRVDTPGNAQDVVVLNGFAYVADGTAGLHVIDVQNPAAPVITATTRLGGNSGFDSIQSLATAGGFLYTAWGPFRLNLNPPNAPTINGGVQMSGMGPRPR